MFDCILLIAGKGTRSKLEFNKVLYEIKEKPLYQYALDTFLGLEECRKVIVVCSAGDLFTIQRQIEKMNNKKIVLTIGGAHRQDSVYEGMKHTESDIVLIHDGARVLVQAQDILSVAKEVNLNQAAALAIPAKDTIKEVYGGFVKHTLDREKLVQMQTPQGVQKDQFLEILKKAKESLYYGSDDVGLIEKYSNMKVKIIDGNPYNFKVTTPEDIEYVKYLIDEGKYGV